MLKFSKSFSELSLRKPTILQDASCCYIGIAAREYAKKFDIEKLIYGEFDKDFSQNYLFFRRICEVFSDQETALKKTARRGTISGSAYVIGVLCQPENLEEVIKAGKLSSVLNTASIINSTNREPFLPRGIERARSN